MPVTINGTSGITSDTGFAADGVSFADNAPANTLVTTASGNVGVGTSSPNRAVSIYRASSPVLQLIDATTGTTSNDGLLIQQVGVDTYIENAEIGFMQFRTSGIERARIDASGNLLVGTTSSSARLNLVPDAAYNLCIRANPNGATLPYNFAIFNNTSTAVGSIVVSSTATAYNTSSDYRLKEAVEPMQGALARNALLNPVRYKWRVDGSDGEGFIAHALQTAFPQAVTGEKDAVDSEGKPQYQGIGTGPLDGHFAACVNELQAIIQSLTQRIATLEGASGANTGVPA